MAKRQKIDDKTLLYLMLTGKSQADIAKMLNMTRTQICRRVNTPEFRKILSEYRTKMIDGILSELSINALKAVNVLVELLDSDNDFVRFNASSKILSLVQDYNLQNDLLHELEEIKESQKQQAELL